jgi:hypothetical protein
MEGEFVYRGTLESTSLPEMLATIHRYGVPGVMEFGRRDDTRRLFFADGNVIFATSSDRSESLGDFLVCQGRITQEQYKLSSDELAESPGKRHGAVLVSMGFIKPEDLGAAVREQVEHILWGLFNWTTGSVTFRVGRFRDDEVFKIKIPIARAIVSGCRHIADVKHLTAEMGGHSGVLRRCPTPEHLNHLPLEAAERELLEMVDGRTALVGLCEKGPLNPGLNARVLFALYHLQLVERETATTGGIKIQVRGGDSP